MDCHACGAAVVEGQKFCQECGKSLRGVTDTTEQFEHRDVVDAREAASGPSEPSADEPAPDPSADDVTVVLARDVLAGAAPSAPGAPPADEATLPDLGDLPTREINPREPLPDPTWAPADAALADLGAAPPPAPLDDGAGQAVSTGDFVLDELDDALAAAGAAAAPAAEAHRTDEVPVTADATTVLPATGPSTTDEFPAVFDGSGDVHHFPPAREPFKLRLTFVLAFFGAVATLMSSAADVTDIRTSTPVDGINIGITRLSDIGVNLPIAGYVGGVVMALGGLLACYGFRWGAGIAGGGGLAVAGWAALTIGLAEVPIAVAESITRTTTTQQFTLTVTRDLGFWLIISAGAIGVLVFAASLRLVGTGGHRSLNPWVAAVGAVSALILAAGPLIPEGGASFEDNFRSPSALIDLPTAYFGGRLAQVALIGLAGVVGFLLVRAYGLGLVAGGISVAVWMWLSALLGIGENLRTGDEPLGISAGNFGAGDTIPHGVTTVGMVLTLLMLLIAAVLATVQYRRDSQRY